jgi:hypothetical protein
MASYYTGLLKLYPFDMLNVSFDELDVWFS